MRAAILGNLAYHGDGALNDPEFRDTLKCVPELGRRLFFWWLEQKWIEDGIHCDDDLSRNQMREKIAESRKRPVAAMSEFERNVFQEALEHGQLSALTITQIANAALDYYFVRPDLSKL
jgi:hypothetical protein